MHHTAGDGMASFNVLKLWSDHCNALQMQGKQLIVDMPPESSERNLPGQLWAKEETRNDVGDIGLRTWLLASLDPTDIQQGPLKASNGHVQPQDKAKPVTSPRILKSGVFYISPSNFTALQKACAKELGDASRISGNDAICALIWRSFMRDRLTARKAVGASINGNRKLADVDPEARLHTFCDGRPNFSSDLPQTYLGNASYDVQSCLPLSSLTSPNSSTAKVAAIIRSDTASVDSAKLLDMYALLKNMADFR
jgi:trichothecene 3-O-acetyltransferase